MHFNVGVNCSFKGEQRTKSLFTISTVHEPLSGISLISRLMIDQFLLLCHALI